MLNAICVIKLMCSKDRVSSIACLRRDLLSQHRGIFKLTITRRHLEKREIVHKNFHSKFWSLVDVSVRLGGDCDPSRVQISFVCATARQAGTQWEDQRSSVVSKLQWHTDSAHPHIHLHSHHYGKFICSFGSICLYGQDKHPIFCGVVNVIYCVHLINV